MSDNRTKWDSRYSSSQALPGGSPCWILQTHQDKLAGHGSALDIACGLGDNAVFLAQHGYQTYAYDISAVAIKKLTTYAAKYSLPVTAQVYDLESQPLASNAFDIVCVSHFLQRNLFSDIINSLKPGGLIFYQTFVKTDASVNGPKNPEFLLESGELRQAFRNLNIIAYYEDNKGLYYPSTPYGNQAALLARKPD